MTSSWRRWTIPNLREAIKACACIRNYVNAYQVHFVHPACSRYFYQVITFTSLDGGRNRLTQRYREKQTVIAMNVKVTVKSRNPLNRISRCHYVHFAGSFTLERYQHCPN
jgi:hypothetical protein